MGRNVVDACAAAGSREEQWTRQQQGSTKACRFLFLVRRAGAKGYAVQVSKLGELVFEYDVRQLMGYVTVLATFISQRTHHNELAVFDLECRGRKRVALKAFEFLELLPVDEILLR